MPIDNVIENKTAENCRFEKKKKKHTRHTTKTNRWTYKRALTRCTCEEKMYENTYRKSFETMCDHALVQNLDSCSTLKVRNNGMKARLLNKIKSM